MPGSTFPRYGIDVHAELARDALYGRLGDWPTRCTAWRCCSPWIGVAPRDQLRALRRNHDVVLLDRYVASNAAYGAARLHEGVEGPFVEWVRGLEVDRFGVLVPDAQLLLRVPMSVAAVRADRRAQADSTRAKDRYETDGGLQARCAAVYDGLAADGWLAPWSIVDGTADATMAGSKLSDLAVQLLGG